MSEIPPMDALFTRPHLSANVCVCVCVCVCARTCDVYACLCQTGEAGRKRETTAGSEASLDSQLLMLQEPKKKTGKTSLSLFTTPISEVVLSPSSSLSLSKTTAAVRSAMSAQQPNFCVCVYFPLINTH